MSTTPKVKKSSAKTSNPKRIIQRLLNVIAPPGCRKAIDAITRTFDVERIEVNLVDPTVRAKVKQLIENAEFENDDSEAELIRQWRVSYQENPGKFDYYAVDDAGRLCHYENGVYIHEGIWTERNVRRRVWDLSPSCSRATSTGVVFHLKDCVLQLQSALKTEGKLNLRNGILDIDKRLLWPHSPAYPVNIQLPVDYDPTATCPEIDKFVNQVFPEDARILAYEILAWIIFSDLSSIHKAILLYGIGRNGKSTYLNLLESLRMNCEVRDEVAFG